MLLAPMMKKQALNMRKEKEAADIVKEKEVVKTQQSEPTAEKEVSEKGEIEKEPVDKKRSQTKKRKTEVNQLDIKELTETRTRKKLILEEEVQIPASSVQKTAKKPMQSSAAEKPKPRVKKARVQEQKRKQAQNNCYPFMSLQAKKMYEEVIQHKQAIKERALNLASFKEEKIIPDIIEALGWTDFCGKPIEGVLPIVKEFYANMGEAKGEEVFVRGVWVPFSGKSINTILKTPEHEEDEFFEMVESEVGTSILEKHLCEKGKTVEWNTGKNNQPLSFNAGALLPQWNPLFKFICSRLSPSTHTSHVTMDRAVLLLAMIKKKGGWIIYNNILESAGPTKALWFHNYSTLCTSWSKIQENRRKSEVGLAINAKASADHLQQGGAKINNEILEELRAVKAQQNRIMELLEHQQHWNVFMKDSFQSGKLNFTNEPVGPTSVFAGPSGAKKKAQPTPPPGMRFKMVARKKVQPLERLEESDDESEEEEEEESQ